MVIGGPEIFQAVSTGGAVVVLTWIVYQFLGGNIYSEKGHKAIVDPLQKTVDQQRQELMELAADSRKAILDVTESQRKSLEEQARTIDVLREVLRQNRAEPPQGSGSGAS